MVAPRALRTPSFGQRRSLVLAVAVAASALALIGGHLAAFLTPSNSRHEHWSSVAGLSASHPEEAAPVTGTALPLSAAVAVLAAGFLGIRQRAKTSGPQVVLNSRRGIAAKSAAGSVARAAGPKVGCVGIVGSSGAVGVEMLKCLEDRQFPTEKVRLFAKRAAGQVVKSAFGDLVVENFSVEAAQECEVVLMAVSGSFSLEFGKQISGGPLKTVVIDNSSAWRYEPDIPLVIPEINGLDGKCSAGLVANPNCTTAIGAMALWPIHQKYTLKKVLMSTYQAASGAGAEGMAELESGLKSWATTGSVPAPEFFAHQLPFNVIPQIDAFQENGYTKEEMKVSWELQKIFGLPDSVKISCTAVRVPTLRAHSESITIETEKPIKPEDVRELLKSSPGVKVVDDPASKQYPMPLNATSKYDVEVGRIRQSIVFGDHGIEFFVSGDQLLRGAALNAVIIAEQSVKERFGQKKMAAAALTGMRAVATDMPSTQTMSSVPPMFRDVPWETHKFGGASLASAELYRTCGDLLIAESGRDGKKIPTAAIVSAMKGMTDKLISVVESACVPGGELQALKKLEECVLFQINTVTELLEGHPALATAIAQNIARDRDDISALLRSLSLLRVVPTSTMEFVAGLGEIWSAQTLCSYLQVKGVPTTWLNARDVLIVEGKDTGLGEKGAALDMGIEPLYEDTTQKLNEWWNTWGSRLAGDRPILVITGFVASTKKGVPTTLKRSGSDYSATIFARLLKSSRVTLWKNVDGVFTADPSLVPDATPVASMNYDEAVELAYFGGQVLHPLAMVPCMADNTPVYVRNIFNPAFKGTKISGRGMGHRSPQDEEAWRKSSLEELSKDPMGPVKALTSIKNIAMVDVEGGSWAGVSKVATRVMGALDAANIAVVLVTQASSEHSMTVAVDEAEGMRAAQVVEKAFELELARGDIDGVRYGGGFSILAIVGDGLKNLPGSAAKLFSSLAAAGVNVCAIAQGSSERNVSVVVEKAKLSLALQAVHSEFIGMARSDVVSVGVIGCGLVGKELLSQMRAFSKNATGGVELTIRAVASSSKMALKQSGLSMSSLSGLEALDAEAELKPLDLSTLADFVQQGSKKAIIVDCTASETVAAEYGKWLAQGISVVTPNKKAGSSSISNYKSLKSAAASGRSHWRYEATVGAGLPLITTLQDLVKTGDKIVRIEGILSGTLSYIFNNFAPGQKFSDIVKVAKEKGFTEPDPRDDLSGKDVQRKCVILARESGLDINLEDVPVESLVPGPLQDWQPPAGANCADAFIEALKDFDSAMEARMAEAGNDVLRYVGVVDVATKSAKVELRRYTKDHPFAAAQYSDNVILFSTERYTPRPLVVQGPGAGAAVTAAGVFADVLAVARAS